LIARATSKLSIEAAPRRRTRASTDLSPASMATILAAPTTS
jgi:hypothetical protein